MDGYRDAGWTDAITKLQLLVLVPYMAAVISAQP